METLIQQLKAAIGKEQVLLQESMKKHTSFQIGGPADIYISPRNKEDIEKSITLAKEYDVPVTVIGNGSNLLVSDKGIAGIVIQIGSGMSDIIIEGERITIQAGALLRTIGTKALEAELAGFAFAAGIPGSFGGAVYMNAGAYGGEMKDILEYADVLTKELEVKRLSVEELQLSYRHSIIPEKGYIVLGGGIQLQKGSYAEIVAEMNDLAEQRRRKQPLEFPSAGSIFKRPEGYFAGKLITDAGLKGCRIGGATVSEKHGGFIVNTGNATCEDVLTLIAHCQKIVFETFGVVLETEVKPIGR